METILITAFLFVYCIGLTVTALAAAALVEHRDEQDLFARNNG